MKRKATWLFAAIVVGAILTPQAVLAAVGNFGSGNSTPAVTGNNSAAGPGGRFGCKGNSCRALVAESYGVSGTSVGLFATSRDPSGRAASGLNTATAGAAVGVFGQTNSTAGRAVNGLAYPASGINYGGFFQTNSLTSSATGAFGWASNPNGASNYGVYGRNDGGGLNASGVFGNATKTAGSPQVNGVWGRAPSTNGAGLFGEGGAYGFYGAGGYIGGFGFGQQVGIAGDTCAAANCVGDGSYGLLSYTDAGVAGHLVQGELGNIAGTCAVTGTNPVTCTFAHAFPAPPLVVATPAGDYGSSSRWWVDSVSTTGFTIKRVGSSGAVTFNWMAVGLDTGMTGIAPGQLSRAKAAGYAR